MPSILAIIQELYRNQFKYIYVKNESLFFEYLFVFLEFTWKFEPFGK